MNKETKLMTRIFAAVENHEEEVLNQIENDMDMTLEDGSLEAEQYSMKKLSDTEVEVTDKVNNGEKTKLSVDGNMINAEAIESDSSEDKEGETKTLDEDNKNETVKEFAKKSNTMIARVEDKDVVFDFNKKLCYFVDKPKVTVTFKDESPITEVMDELKAKSKTFTDGDKPISTEKIESGTMTRDEAYDEANKGNDKTKAHSNFEGISEKYIKTFTARHRERVKLEMQNRNLDKLSPNVRAYVEKRLAEINKK